MSNHHSEFVTHPIHLRNIDITKVDIPYDDDVDLKVGDREEKKKEEDENMEVLDENVNGTIDDDR